MLTFRNSNLRRNSQHGSCGNPHRDSGPRSFWWRTHPASSGGGFHVFANGEYRATLHALRMSASRCWRSPQSPQRVSSEVPERGATSTRAAAHWPTLAMRCAIVWGCGDIRSTRIALSVDALVAGRVARATTHPRARPQPPVVRSGYACSHGSCVCCGRRRGRNSAGPPHVRATLHTYSGQPATARPCL
jgi:hypothetical protein